ncbi:MAG: DNA gyrase inhibitor YacG [Planctomycetota bacterium]
MTAASRTPEPDFGPPRCPICNAPREAHAPHAPFCSARCKKIDLGRWLDEQYVISRPVEQRDLEEGAD